MVLKLDAGALHNLAVQCGLSSDRVPDPSGEVVRMAQLANPLRIELGNPGARTIEIQMVGRTSIAESATGAIEVSLLQNGQTMFAREIQLTLELRRVKIRHQPRRSGDYTLVISAATRSPFVLKELMARV